MWRSCWLPIAARVQVCDSFDSRVETSVHVHRHISELLHLPSLYNFDVLAMAVRQTYLCQWNVPNRVCPSHLHFVNPDRSPVQSIQVYSHVCFLHSRSPITGGCPKQHSLLCMQQHPRHCGCPELHVELYYHIHQRPTTIAGASQQQHLRTGTAAFLPPTS